MDTVELEPEAKSKLLPPLLLSPTFSWTLTPAEGLFSPSPTMGFDRIDVDQDGSISKEEWFDFLNANHDVRDAPLGEQRFAVPGFLLETRKQQAIFRAMRELDTNNNGTLESSELIEGFRRMGQVDHQVGTAPIRPSSRPQSRGMDVVPKEPAENQTTGVASGLGSLRPGSRNMNLSSSKRVDYRMRAAPIASALASLRPASRSESRPFTERVVTPRKLARLPTGSRNIKQVKLGSAKNIHDHQKLTGTIGFCQGSLRAGGTASLTPRKHRRTSHEISVVIALLGK
mmetsp:Transcript_22259/g.42508  ORF Transcript_22259/g.42508 Transcript_22259/m.42508 type:complete len:286 (-) Transcript_22259:127-984(-)